MIGHMDMDGGDMVVVEDGCSIDTSSWVVEEDGCSIETPAVWWWWRMDAL